MRRRNSSTTPDEKRDVTLAPESRPAESETDPVVEKILAALTGLKFGSVEITVHEGRVVQIERREKHRFNIPCPGA
jgi:hypothetical protein